MTDSLVLVTPDVPHQVRDEIARLEGVRVDEASAGALVSGGAVEPMRVVYLDATALVDLERSAEGATLAIIGGVIDLAAATRLEDAGIAYVDAAGHAWVPGARRSPAARQSSPGRAGLGFAQTRAAQLLADRPDERWTERLLAERASVSTRAAHALFERLEEDGVVSRRGRTRGTTRTLEAGPMRRWLAEHARPRHVSSLTCFLPDDALFPAETSGVPLALTGAAAAELIGRPVLLGAPRRLVRAGAGREEIEDLPAALGGFRTDRGANTTLVADPHLLAFTGDREVQGARVAPPSRIMLDLYLEPRGSSAVDVFLDLWPSS